MESFDSNTVVPASTIAALTAAVARVHNLEQQRRLLSRLVFSQAHTLKGAQLLTLLYADKLIVREEAALAAA